MKRLISTILALLLVACDRPETKPSAVTLIPVETSILAQEVGDGSYFSDITQICYTGNEYFLADNKENRILVFDDQFQLKRKVGGPGQGPGEFEGLVYFTKVSQGIFGFSEASRQMAWLDPFGQPIDNFQIPDANIMTPFCLQNDGLFLSATRFGHAIAKFDLKGHKVAEFGPANDSTAERPEFFHLFPYSHDSKPYIVALSATAPKVEIYSVEGQLLHSNLLDNHPSVRGTMEAVAAHSKRLKDKQNTWVQVFSGGCIYRDFFFVFGGNQEHRYVLVYQIEDLELHLIKTFFGDKGSFQPYSFAYAPQRGIVFYNTASGNIEWITNSLLEK